VSARCGTFWEPGVRLAICDLPLIPEPYTRGEVLDYWRACDELVDGAVDALNLHDPVSGFSWYEVPKFEHQIINIRHIQHHTAQLADRLRAAADVGINWVGAPDRLHHRIRRDSDLLLMRNLGSGLRFAILGQPKRKTS